LENEMQDFWTACGPLGFEVAGWDYVNRKPDDVQLVKKTYEARENGHEVNPNGLWAIAHAEKGTCGGRQHVLAREIFHEEMASFSATFLLEENGVVSDAWARENDGFGEVNGAFLGVNCALRRNALRRVHKSLAFYLIQYPSPGANDVLQGCSY